MKDTDIGIEGNSEGKLLPSKHRSALMKRSQMGVHKSGPSTRSTSCEVHIEEQRVNALPTQTHYELARLTYEPQRPLMSKRAKEAGKSLIDLVSSVCQMCDPEPTLLESLLRNIPGLLLDDDDDSTVHRENFCLKEIIKSFIEMLNFRLNWSLMSIELEDVLIGASMLFKKGVEKHQLHIQTVTALR